MDPATVIGVTASVIAFIDISTKIVRRLEELSQAGDVPKVFRDVRTRLPIILQIAERARDGARNLHPDTRASVDEIVRNCHEHVEKLEKILASVTVRSSDSRWKRGAIAVTSLIQEERVERIATALKNNVDLLTSLNVSPIEKHMKDKADEQRESVAPPPSYDSAQTQFHVPFERDETFIGRTAELEAVTDGFRRQSRIGIVGIGGVGYVLDASQCSLI